MGMGGGGGTDHAVSDINVTPLIDVLLVLLIIFMVIVPITPKGLNTLIPQPPKDKSNPPPDNDRTIVVQVISNKGGPPGYKINEDDFAKAALEPKLEQIFSTRQAQVGLKSQIPQPSKVDAPTPPSTVVVEVLPGAGSEPIYKINQTAVPRSEMLTELRTIFAPRRDRTMFVKGDAALTFKDVAEV